MTEVHRAGSDITAASPDDSATDVRTFMFSDVRGYTAFSQSRGDEAAATLAAEFVKLCRKAVEARGGRVLELRGDEALAVFQSPRAALRTAIELQRSVGHLGRENPDLPLRVGVGIDADEAVPFEGGYRGRALNLASRLCNAAGAGEVLVSETVMTLAGRIPGLNYGMPQSRRFKGFSDPVTFARVWDSKENSDLSDSAASGADGTQQGINATTRLPIGGFLGARPESSLVKQGEAQERVESILEAVRRGAGRTALVTGEPGIGKTRLAQEIACKAIDGGFLVGTATCYEQRQTSPLFGFRELLRSLVEQYVGWTELREGWPVIARLFVSDAASLNADKPTEGTQDQLYEEVAAFVETVAEGQPTALMLDDLQWSDASTLDLFTYLARRSRASPVLLVGTYRDSELGSAQALAAAVYELERQSLVDRIAMKGLSRDETSVLASNVAGERVSPEVASMLYESTEGNPFYVREMLHALIDQGDLKLEDSLRVARPARSIRVPDRVRALVDRRLSCVSREDRALLCEASVLGNIFSFPDLRALTESSEEQIEAALENATSADILREHDADHFAFAHTLIRQTLYDSLSGRKRRRLHISVGEAYASARSNSPPGGDRPTASEIAWHFMKADDAKRALPYAVSAGEEAESIGAYAEAERQYRIALELGTSVNDDTATADVLERLAMVLKTLGRYDESAELAERAVQMYEHVANQEGQRRSIALVGLLELLRDRPLDGLARLAPILEESTGAQLSSGLARLYATQAQLLLASGHYQAGGKAADRASEIARLAGDMKTEMETEVYRGESLGLLGDFVAARQILETVAERVTDTDLPTAVRALNGVAAALFYAGRFEERTACHQRAVALARRSKDPRVLSGALVALAAAQIAIGDWRAAGETASEAPHISEKSNVAVRVVESRIALAYLALLKGDTSEGFEPWSEHSPATDHSLVAADFWSVALAARLVLDTHYGQALEELRRNSAGEKLIGWHAGFRSLTEAAAYVGLRELDRAENIVENVASKAMSQHNRPTLAEALVVRGQIRLAQARWDEAERLLQAAEALAHGMPYPYVEACALAQIAEVLRQRGARQESRLALDQALGIFRRLGARPNMRLILSSVAGG